MAILPLIRIANLNVWWTNGSRVKPGAPIPLKIRDQFEIKENYKINWLSRITGLITLKGEYNYLIFKEKYYFLVKTSVVDIEKEIYVYTATFDYWMTFISNPNNYINGCLINTNDEPLVWNHIQRTKAAISEVNSETVLKVCTKEDCSEEILKNQLDITPFERDEDGNIVQFGYKYRFGRRAWKAFMDKLNQNYHEVSQKPNKIYAYCKLTKTPNWENYISGLLEDFFRDTDDLVVGTITPTDLSTFSSGMATSLKDIYEFKSTYYTLVKEKSQHVKTTKTNDILIKKIDLAKITQIRYVKTQNLEDVDVLNKSIFDLVDDKTFKPSKDGVTTWDLKNKMYSPQDIEHTYKGYLNIGPIQKQSYELYTELIESKNLGSLDKDYKAHGLDFKNNYVPAFYYQTWTDVIEDKNLLSFIRLNNINTEMGFLLYKISDYYNTTIEAQNKHVYNGNKLLITTGLKLKDEQLLCNEVIDIDTNKLTTGTPKYALFSEVYREDIEKSLWLTLWSVYLWQGEIDRVFVGLYKGGLLEDFKYTVPKCYSKNGEIWTITKQTESKEDNESKLPTYEEPVLSFKTNKKSYGDALKTLNNRRKSIEINQSLINIPIDEGDIYFNQYQHGYFADSTNKELNINEPSLVVYSDVGYMYSIGENELWSLKDDDQKGFKLGILNRKKPLDVIPNKDNIIISDLKLPYIYYLKPLLINKPTGITNDWKQFALDMKEFLVNKLKNPNTYTEEGYDLEYEAFPTGVNWAVSRDIHVVLYDKTGKTKWIDGQIDINRNWIKKDLTTNELSLIKRITVENNTIHMHLMNGWTQKLQVYQQFYKFGYIARESDRDYYNEFVARLIRKDFLVSRYQKGSINFTSTSSESIEAVKYDLLLPDQTTLNTQAYKDNLDSWRPGSSYSVKGRLQNVVEEVYERVNSEKISSTSQTFGYIDEEYLRNEGKEGRKQVFELLTEGDVLLYAIIHWAKGAKKPTIQLIIADNRLIAHQEKSVTLTLAKSNSLTNSNLIQVANQQNFLYVHGHTFPIKTKIIGVPGINDFVFRVDNILPEDPIQSHYLVYFEGARDLIKTNISVVKKELKNITGPKPQELIEMRWQMEENRKNRELAWKQWVENERKGGQYIRNKGEDIKWDETTGRDLVITQASFGIISSTIGAVAGGIATGGAGAAYGALGIGSSIAGAVEGIYRHDENIRRARRDLKEQEVQHAFNVEQSKNTLENRHKYEEMREKNRLYESINTIINSVPNNADVLEALQRIDLIENGVAIYNRMPAGELLELLTNYHKNWGFDLTINEYLLSVKNLNKEGTIYQFSRVDYVSVDDLDIKEAITNIFTNGIYLKQTPYEIKNLTILTYKDIKKVKETKKQIEENKKRQEEHRKQLEEAKAAAEGTEKAKRDYDRLVKEKEECEKGLASANIELRKASKEIVKLNDDILAYKAHDKTNRGDYAQKLNQLKAAKEALENEKQILTNQIGTKNTTLNLLNIQLEQAHTSLSTLTDDYNRLLKDLSTSDQEIERKNKEIEEKTNELSEVKVNLQNITDELNTTKDNLAAKNDEFDRCVASGVTDSSAKQALQEEINRLKGKEAELTTEKAKSTQYLTDLQRIRGNYNTCVRSNNACVAREKQLKTETDAKIKELEEGNAAIQQQARQLTTELNEKDEQITGNLRQIEAKDGQIRTLEQSNSDLTEKLNECEARVPDTAELNTCKEQLRHKTEDLTAEKAKTSAQTKTIQQQATQLLRKVQQFNTERSEHNRTKTTLQAKTRDLEAKTRELDTEKRSYQTLNDRFVRLTRDKASVDDALKNCQGGQVELVPLRNELATCKNDLRIEKGKSTTFQSSLTNERAKSKRLQGEKDTANKALGKVQVELRDTKEELRDAKENVTRLEGDLRTCQAQRGNSEELGRCQESLRQERAKIKPLEDKIKKLEADLAGEKILSSRLEGDLTEEEKTSASYLAQLQACQAGRVDTTPLTTRIAELEAKVKKESEAAQKLRGDYNRCVGSNNAAIRERDQARRDLSTEQSKNLLCTTDLAQEQAKTKKLEGDLRTCQTQKNDCNRRITTLEARIKTQEEEIEEYQVQLQSDINLKKELDTCKAQLQECKGGQGGPVDPNELERCKAALEELAKKKNKLEELRATYKDWWDKLISMWNESTGLGVGDSINKVIFRRTPWTRGYPNAGHVLTMTKNILFLKGIGTDQKDSTPILGTSNDEDTAEGTYQLTPADWEFNFHDKEGFYRGFTFQRGNVNQVEFELNYHSTNYDRAGEFRWFGKNLLIKANEIRAMHKEIADHIKNNCSLFPNLEGGQQLPQELREDLPWPCAGSLAGVYANEWMNLTY